MSCLYHNIFLGNAHIFLASHRKQDSTPNKTVCFYVPILSVTSIKILLYVNTKDGDVKGPKIWSIMCSSAFWCEIPDLVWPTDHPPIYCIFLGGLSYIIYHMISQNDTFLCFLADQHTGGFMHSAVPPDQTFLVKLCYFRHCLAMLVVFWHQYTVTLHSGTL